MNARTTIGVLLVSLCIFPFLACATDLDIHYPNNNTSTVMYYGNDTGYHTNETNYLNTTDINVVILKDQIVTETDILNNPKVLYRSMLIVFYVIVMGFVLIIMSKIVRGTLK